MRFQDDMCSPLVELDEIELELVVGGLKALWMDQTDPVNGTPSETAINRPRSS